MVIQLRKQGKNLQDPESKQRTSTRRAIDAFVSWMERQVAFDLAIRAGYLGPRTAEKNLYAMISANENAQRTGWAFVLYPYFQNSNLEGVNPTVFANLFRQWFQQHRRNSSSAGG